MLQLGIVVLLMYTVMAEEKRMGIKIITHMPCKLQFKNKTRIHSGKSSDTWQPTVVFANTSNNAPLRADPAAPGCYALTGLYKVRAPVKGQLQMYSEVWFKNACFCFPTLFEKR